MKMNLTRFRWLMLGMLFFLSSMTTDVIYNLSHNVNISWFVWLVIWVISYALIIYFSMWHESHVYYLKPHLIEEIETELQRLGYMHADTRDNIRYYFKQIGSMRWRKTTLKIKDKMIELRLQEPYDEIFLPYSVRYSGRSNAYSIDHHHE